MTSVGLQYTKNINLFNDTGCILYLVQSVIGTYTKRIFITVLKAVVRIHTGVPSVSSNEGTTKTCMGQRCGMLS